MDKPKETKAEPRSEKFEKQTEKKGNVPKNPQPTAPPPPQTPKNSN